MRYDEPQRVIDHSVDVGIRHGRLRNDDLTVHTVDFTPVPHRAEEIVQSAPSQDRQGPTNAILVYEAVSVRCDTHGQISSPRQTIAF